MKLTSAASIADHSRAGEPRGSNSTYGPHPPSNRGKSGRSFLLFWSCTLPLFHPGRTMKKPVTQKALAAAGPKNAASTSAAQNAKVFAAAAEAGVRIPASPKPAPRQKR